MPSLMTDDPSSNKNGLNHVRSWQHGIRREVPAAKGSEFDPMPNRSPTPEHDRTSSSDSDLTEESSIVGSESPTTRTLPRVGLLGDVAAKPSLATPRRVSTHTMSDEDVEKKAIQAEGALKGTNQAKWEKSFQRLKEYKTRYGHCRVPSKLDRALSVWVNNQRYQLHANRRCQNKQDRIDRLDSLGFDWGCAHPNSSNHDVSMKGSFVEDPNKLEGDQPNEVESDDLAVGRAERLQYDSEVMDCATTILALSSAGPPKMQGQNPCVHEHHRTQTPNGCKRAGAIVPPCANNEWTMNQPMNRSHTRHQQIDRLHRMQYLLNNRDFYNGCAYDTKNSPHAWSMNHMLFTDIHDAVNQKPIASTSCQRDEQQTSNLRSQNVAPSGDFDYDIPKPHSVTKQEDIKKAFADKRSANQHEINWLKSFERLKRFHADHGHCQISRKQDKTLYTWASNQRQHRHEGHRYRQERIDLLNSIGFQWGSRKHVTSAGIPADKVQDKLATQADILGRDGQSGITEKYNVKQDAAEVLSITYHDGKPSHETFSVDYASETHVPSQSRLNASQHREACGCDKGKCQSENMTQSTSSDDAADCTQNSGFSGHHHLTWQNRFQNLNHFQAENGHCQVQQNHDQELHGCVHNQRSNLCEDFEGYRRERVDSLNSIGFYCGAERRMSSSGNALTIDTSEAPVKDSRPTPATKDTSWNFKNERSNGPKWKKSHARLSKGRNRVRKCLERSHRTPGRDYPGYKKDRFNLIKGSMHHSIKVVKNLCVEKQS